MRIHVDHHSPADEVSPRKEEGGRSLSCLPEECGQPGLLAATGRLYRLPLPVGELSPHQAEKRAQVLNPPTSQKNSRREQIS